MDALLHPEISAIATLIAIDFPFSHRDPGFVESQLRRYPDLVLVRKAQNISLYEAWNEAIALASTEFVGNLNLDDRVAPGYYAKAVAALDGLGADVFSSFSIVTRKAGRWEDGLKLQEHVPASRFGGKDITGYGLESLVTLGEGRIVKKNPPHCAPLWRRSLHEELGWFDSRSFDFCADYAFWLKVAAAGKKMVVAREPLTLFHSASGTASDRLMHPESEAILARWKPAFPPKGYKPSRLGERNNFLHFCLNMNAIFASPRYYTHLGDVTLIDGRYAIGLERAAPKRFADALLARFAGKSPPKAWGRAGGQAVWQARFDLPAGTRGLEFVAGLALCADRAIEVQASLGGEGEETRQAVRLAAGIETEIHLRLRCSGQHPALRVRVDAPGQDEGGLAVRAVYLNESLASLRERIAAGRIDLREANRLFRAGDFRAALDIYRLLYAAQPFQIYLDNALWCACKMGMDLSFGTDGLVGRHA